MRRKPRPLPQPYLCLVQTIRAHSPESGGGENREAVAELNARIALAQIRISRSLVFSSWVLVVVTMGSVITQLL